MPIRPNLREAANFLGDSFADSLAGADGKQLSGFYSLDAAKLFDTLIDELKKDCSSADLENISEMIKNVTFLAVKDPSQKIKELKAKIQGRQNFLVLWGWSDPRHGHAMLAEFVNIDQEKYNFSVYNTGNGIQYHEQSIDGGSYKIQPYIDFENIPVEIISDDSFIEAFVSSMHSMLENKEKTTENDKFVTSEDLYEVVLQDLIPFQKKDPHLSDELRKDSSEELVIRDLHTTDRFQKPQLGGTCTNSCLWAFLLRRMDTVEKYKLVKEKMF